jgi:peptidoglycan/LPS O-acetylase OafA/YrhL
VTEIHRYVGYVVVGIFTIGWLFGLGLWIARREPGDWFWRWLVAAQTVAIVQALIGAILLLAGHRPPTALHYVYGFGPLVVFAIAHVLGREDPFRTRPWIPFAMASFISFGLSLRALATGLGIG